MIRARPLHKWIGILVGLVLLMWSITGIVMMLPGSRPSTDGRARIDFSRASVSPAQVIAAMGDSIPQVRSISIIQIYDLVAYRLDTARRPVLIDASSGGRIEITPALAESVARQAMGGGSGTLSVEVMSSHDRGYSTGSLPVYRVAMGGTTGYVSQLDGAFIPSNTGRKWKALVHDLHNFSVIKLVIHPDWVYRTSAIFVSLVSIVSIFTGYWLALPRPKRKARVTEPLTMRTQR